MQVQARQQADNEKSADRVRNCIVDSNKFQAELEQLQQTTEQQQPVVNPVPQTPPTLKSKRKKLFLTPASLRKLKQKMQDIFAKKKS